MGKHEPMTAKAIANRIKAKGLQKIKYYCEMCKKQCRDDNGFKCHIASEAHQRQALIVSEDPEKFVNEFSKEFMAGFMYLLKTRYRSKRVLANTVFQEYIKERDHIHMNGTRWTTLTEFANWLGDNGIVKVDDSERGVMVTYIDRDPETLRRQELEAKRAEQAKEAAEQNEKEIRRQREATKKLYDEIESKRQLSIEPIPIVKMPLVKGDVPTGNEQIFNDSETTSGCEPIESTSLAEPSTSKQVSGDVNNEAETIERPLFKVQTFALKSTGSSAFKPPPPKRKVTSKTCGFVKKKSKTS